MANVEAVAFSQEHALSLQDESEGLASREQRDRRGSVDPMLDQNASVLGEVLSSRDIQIPPEIVAVHSIRGMHFRRHEAP